MPWSPQQEQALRRARRWLQQPDRFRLHGYAGTGKTELARELGYHDSRVHFAAFTGKAAHVLRQRGCEPVSTIHHLIYRPLFDDHDNVVGFERRRRDELFSVGLIVVDECSMINDRLAADLLSYEIPLLLVGDPEQLPPITGGAAFMREQPDAVLTQIHRQAAENPILRLADSIRRGEALPRPGYRAGDSLLITNDDRDGVHDVVLVGLNDTRRRINRIRRRRFGFKSEEPRIGESVVCLRNDHSVGVFNGSTWEVTRSAVVGQPPIVNLKLSNDYDRVSVQVPLHCFTNPNDSFDWLQGLQRFDFGYGLTVHKSQGSEWGDVALINESGAFGEQARRWLYTGITRASNRLTIVDYN
jgi:exodeoxyribonuclease V